MRISEKLSISYPIPIYLLFDIYCPAIKLFVCRQIFLKVHPISMHGLLVFPSDTPNIETNFHLRLVKIIVLDKGSGINERLRAELAHLQP